MPTIYCVEDDNGIRELISCALRSGGYGVKAFPMAKPFYEELEANQPSLILLDIMLPNEDGLSVLSKLKADPKYKDIPVIMLTAKSSEIDKVSGLELGADDYITKPFVNGQEVALTYREFELLMYLMRHVSIAVSRDKLMERVWGYEFAGETRTVDMHIKTIRQKLEAAGCTDLIKTVRGVGYKV